MAFEEPAAVITTLALVVPGFVALSIALSAVGIRRKMEWDEYLVWSAFLSAVIDLSLISLLGTGLPASPEAFLVSAASPQGAAAYVGLVLAFSVVAMLPVRFNLRQHLQSAVWGKEGPRDLGDLAWDYILDLHHGQWVVAESKDDHLVKGVLAGHSTGQDARSLYLMQPSSVTYGDDGLLKKSVPLGAAILVLDEELLAIRFRSAAHAVAGRASSPNSGTRPTS